MLVINPLARGDSVVSIVSQYLHCFAMCPTDKNQQLDLLFINHMHNNCEPSECNEFRRFYS
jgi:hypothetical protein